MKEFVAACAQFAVTFNDVKANVQKGVAWLEQAVKENEQKLIESDSRIRSLFERVEHAVFRTDRNGTIVEANGKFRSMFGGVTGLCDILIGDTNPSHCLSRAASEKVLHFEDKAISRTGEELSISLSLYSEWDGAGDLAGFDGYILDVTEKKQLEERLTPARGLHARRLRAICRPPSLLGCGAFQDVRKRRAGGRARARHNREGRGGAA